MRSEEQKPLCMLQGGLRAGRRISSLASPGRVRTTTVVPPHNSCFFFTHHAQAVEHNQDARTAMVMDAFQPHTASSSYQSLGTAG
jgi:hypothetical protein